MTFREHLNLAYFRLVDGKDKVERAKVDAMLAPPEQQEALLAKQNQLAMQEIMARSGMQMIGPKPRPRPDHLRVVQRDADDDNR